MYFLFTNFHIHSYTHTHTFLSHFFQHCVAQLFLSRRRQLSQLPSCVPVCLTVRMQAKPASLLLHTLKEGESVAKRVCWNCILIVCWSTHTCAIMGSIVLSLCQLFSVRAPQGRERARASVLSARANWTMPGLAVCACVCVSVWQRRRNVKPKKRTTTTTGRVSRDSDSAFGMTNLLAIRLAAKSNERKKNTRTTRMCVHAVA